MRLRSLIASVLLSLAVSAQAVKPRNLGFDDGEIGKAPPNWPLPADLAALGYSAVVSRQEGCASKCLVVSAERSVPQIGSLSQSIPAASYRGRGVRYSARLRLDPGAPGHRIQLWLRVTDSDGRIVYSDSMEQAPVIATRWETVKIDGFVPGDGETLTLGVGWSGRGKAMADDVDLTVLPSPESAVADLSGAQRALRDLYKQIDRAYESGDSSLVAGVLASDAKVVSGTIKTPFEEVFDGIRQDLQRGAKYTSSSLLTYAQFNAEGVVATIRQQRRRQAAANPWEVVYVTQDTWGNGPFGWRLTESKVLSSRAVAPPLDPARNAEIAAALKQRAVPLDRLEPFDQAVGDARVVGLGEAVSGSKETFEAKLALLKYLVEQKGFSVLALESSWPAAEALDRYINAGEGGDEASLEELNLWPWYIAEARQAVRWMRSYNQSRGARPALHVAPIDAQASGPAARRVLDFLKKHSPADQGAAAVAYAQTSALESNRGGVKDSTGRTAAKEAGDIIAIFDRKREEFTRASSVEAWRDARHAAATVFQSTSMLITGQSYLYRDSVLASNVAWLATDAYPAAKIVVWSTNIHVRSGRGLSEEYGMGTVLRDRFGAGYFSVASMLRNGRVSAVSMTGGRLTALGRWYVPPGADETGDAQLSAVGLPAFFLDVKSIPGDSPLGRWLDRPHLFYDFGTVWNVDAPSLNLRSEALSRLYDALIFINDVSPVETLLKPAK
ncbi:MAG: erythromycin esterase family protein [Acidobacteria bacterium]|nr:erythromycin esterase family protein [Acidobacteriota bacterium]